MDTASASHSHPCLRIGDMLMSLVVITPLTLFWWSGTWKILDLYLLPELPFESSWMSLGIGTFIGIIGFYILPLINDFTTAECSLKHILISRTFIFIYAAGIINYWRGIWNLSDHFLGKGFVISLCSFLISHFFLILLRSTGNNLGPPYTVSMDHRNDFYETKPRFRTQIDSLIIFTLDVLCSHLIIHTLNIQVWRGLWNSFDHLIIPGDKRISYYISLGAGYGSVILIFACEHLFYLAAKKLHNRHWLLGLILEDLVKLIAVIAGLLLWRGGWGFMKDYVLVPPSDIRDCWLFHGVGVGLLMVFSASSTLAPVSCAVDGEEESGQGVLWPINYCTYLYWSWRTRQQRPLRNMPVASPEEDAEDSPLLQNSNPTSSIYT